MGAESDFEAAAGRLREYEVIDWLVVVMGISAAGYGAGYITCALIASWRWRRFLDSR